MKKWVFIITISLSAIFMMITNAKAREFPQLPDDCVHYAIMWDDSINQYVLLCLNDSRDSYLATLNNDYITDVNSLGIRYLSPNPYGSGFNSQYYITETSDSWAFGCGSPDSCQLEKRFDIDDYLVASDVNIYNRDNPDQIVIDNKNEVKIGNEFNFSDLPDFTNLEGYNDNYIIIYSPTYDCYVLMFIDDDKVYITKDDSFRNSVNKIGLDDINFFDESKEYVYSFANGRNEKWVLDVNNKSLGALVPYFYMHPYNDYYYVINHRYYIAATTIDIYDQDKTTILYSSGLGLPTYTPSLSVKDDKLTLTLTFESWKDESIKVKYNYSFVEKEITYNDYLQSNSYDFSVHKIWIVNIDFYSNDVRIKRDKIKISDLLATYDDLERAEMEAIDAYNTHINDDEKTDTNTIKDFVNSMAVPINFVKEVIVYFYSKLNTETRMFLVVMFTVIFTTAVIRYIK